MSIGVIGCELIHMTNTKENKGNAILYTIFCMIKAAIIGTKENVFPSQTIVKSIGKDKANFNFNSLGKGRIFQASPN